jgi:dUTP pyrophosphatase
VKYSPLFHCEQVEQLTKEHDMDAGLDIASNMEAIIPAKQSMKITTGIRVAIDPGYYGQVASRSGLKFKYGIVAFPGVIDSDYRGELSVILDNNGVYPFKVEKGMRIAQLLTLPCCIDRYTKVEYLDETDRGMGGFGSTGV